MIWEDVKFPIDGEYKFEMEVDDILKIEVSEDRVELNSDASMTWLKMGAVVTATLPPAETAEHASNSGNVLTSTVMLFWARLAHTLIRLTLVSS